MAFGKIFVSDIDGTMTQHDFYTCAVELLLSTEDLKPWHADTRQQITHFEVLRVFLNGSALACRKWNACLTRWSLMLLQKRQSNDSKIEGGTSSSF